MGSIGNWPLKKKRKRKSSALLEVKKSDIMITGCSLAENKRFKGQIMSFSGIRKLARIIRISRRADQ